jgi:hypothetical protein
MQMPHALPIACTLSPEQLTAERDTLLTGLADHAVQRIPIPSGIRLRFSATAERMRQIDTVVRRERECCPFLDFHVGLAMGGSSLTLDVTGPEGTDRMLAMLLDSEAVAA